MRARILLADQNPSFLQFLQQVLGGEFDVVAAVSDGSKAVQLTQELTPDVVLLGLAFGACGGLEVTRRMREVIPGVKVINLSMHSDRAYVEEALKAGSSGFLLKSAERAELVTAILQVIGGEIYVGEGLLRPGARDLRPSC
ncbi:MAG TPA: response regulator transcription factor [Vicinamibacteria bacterium]